ncbi:hypothetical protein PQJ75_17805 [Rhodoplanes sp. TEM]|uniref:Uncharacterized protein n=1 Tax=Rhodoplanes tepidamans TaxID=200616 RepID=A0ABT5JM64_RHOTP|nr:MULTISPECIES: hypothetical protein [Rhodoplanes]MDC7789890.1 hypothetical protein [Rhodoplanes tepidamans]MDC7985589.1 hypothetical protein [Rhodoplanes sp. TEM]MDQ0358784.1 polyhydroxyalkanoate synthesis regulator phasin [Rhodoplanes tepidamans]
MAEIENHTIRLLQELREGLTRLEAKVNDGFEHISDEFEDLRKVMAGETVLGRMAAKSVDDRLTDLERRVGEIERRG